MSSNSRRPYRKEPSPSLLGPSESTDWDSLPPSPRSGLAEKFSLSADPANWGSNLSPNLAEPDDFLHDPRGKDETSFVLSTRGLANVGCLVFLCLALLALFIGYPVVTFVKKTFLTTDVTSASVNSTGQDLETPQDAYTMTSLYSGKEMKLVFSDEFNTDGRTFYPGDDPYWEAVDLHYWATNNMEWYDPAAVTTANGSLHITLSAKQTHGLDYQGGVGCSNGTNNIHGLWPAVWSMGNLGRAGYGATLDGTWPYTYDSCDVGTAPNQTYNALPLIATTSGDTNVPYNGELSYLGGQRLSRCTCKGESHPGPVHEDGTYVGRAAPEIDIGDTGGAVSQSGQWAPFNAGYVWFNTSDNLIIANASASVLNTYTGGAYQQATSVVTQTNQLCYELLDNCFAIYGFEYISWISDDQIAWTIKAAGLAADTQTQIGARPVPQEPMYILANLGMSTNFGVVDLEHLTFPTTLKLDYVRVYQYADSVNIGCDPPDFPTQAYINTYIEVLLTSFSLRSQLTGTSSIQAYTNPNLTTWVDDFGQTVPKNSFLNQC
ncbi:glycoside hydrolase family 16 protein [Mycena metata]|uniref:Glycoside hydrolase family 16 protein n=1 Tax=Mycena metata TaxID=1033252 RepID=A0AAD7JQD3_9AGAR|nr:glycoside hydrolase family 16 protein [Mycena metata]